MSRHFSIGELEEAIELNADEPQQDTEEVVDMDKKDDVDDEIDDEEDESEEDDEDIEEDDDVDDSSKDE